jgi:hypothetical protein
MIDKRSIETSKTISFTDSNGKKIFYHQSYSFNF